MAQQPDSAKIKNLSFADLNKEDPYKEAWEYIEKKNIVYLMQVNLFLARFISQYNCKKKKTI